MTEQQEVPLFASLRNEFQEKVCSEIIYLKTAKGTKKQIPSIADAASRLSVNISERIIGYLGHPLNENEVKGQKSGTGLEGIVKWYLETAFGYLQHLRPGQWEYSAHTSIDKFVQYKHLRELKDLADRYPEIKTALGEYLITPDVVVARHPVTDAEINKDRLLVSPESHPFHTRIRVSKPDGGGSAHLILHASISCKFTLRSDRSQNARTEGLNLMRNRKGHTPHIAVVTAEPLPSRLASLALGTGDIDCVYHVALDELILAVKDTENEEAIDELNTLIKGERIRDISDLPFDLSI